MGFAVVALVPGVAAAASEELVVVGSPDGMLAAQSLLAGRFETALAKLEPMQPYGENDPARLINLGNAYAAVGRTKQAREAYRAAGFAPEMTLLLANGEEESSRTVARRALGRLNPSYAAR
nr:tetratricopeptide repeat protein [Sphingobium sp. OAS761]